MPSTCPGFGAKQRRRKTFGPFVPGALAAIRKEAAVVLGQVQLGKDIMVEARQSQKEAAQANPQGSRSLLFTLIMDLT
jgi:hypothetical protein